MGFTQLYEITRKQLTDAVEQPISTEANDVLNSKKPFSSADAFLAFQVTRAAFPNSKKMNNEIKHGILEGFFSEETLSEEEAQSKLESFLNLIIKESSQTDGRPIPLHKYEKYLRSASVLNAWAKTFATENNLNVDTDMSQAPSFSN